MAETTYVAVSLASTLRRALDVTANNIANANTAGFKSERLVFESFLPDAEMGEEQAQFVHDTGSYMDPRQGAVTRTDNPLDIAVQGDGWLGYLTETGQQGYGRDGALALDPQGMLVTTSGARILDIGGAPIAIPPDQAGQISIAEDGTIAGPNGPLARIGVFAIPDIQAYQRIGNGILVPPEGVPAPTPSINSSVVQGALETSNVQPVLEMTRMLDIQKAYERATTLMKTEDDILRDTLRRLGQAV